MLDRQGAIDDLERRWIRGLWRNPFTATRAGTEWAVAIGQLSATLTEWAAEQIDDNWFEKHAGARAVARVD